MSAKERKELMRQALRAYWDALSPEERSAEMKRRAKQRKKPNFERLGKSLLSLAYRTVIAVQQYTSRTRVRMA